MKTHELKTDPGVFEAVKVGLKTFEIRFDDRGFEVGDQLLLRKTRYTGEEMKSGASLVYLDSYTVTVNHILYGPCYGLADGWVIMSIVPQQSAVRNSSIAAQCLAEVRAQAVEAAVEACRYCGSDGQSWQNALEQHALQIRQQAKGE